MSTPVYIALCLIVPVVWGVVSSVIFDRWQAAAAAAKRRRGGESTQDANAPEAEDMYYI